MPGCTLRISPSGSDDALHLLNPMAEGGFLISLASRSGQGAGESACWLVSRPQPGSIQPRLAYLVIAERFWARAAKPGRTHIAIRRECAHRCNKTKAYIQLLSLPPSLSQIT